MKEIRCELCREVVAMCCCVRCEHCSTLNTETVRGVLRSRCAHCRKGLTASEDVELSGDKFYFATISTYHTVSALADSREKAEALVVEKAKQYLDTARATDPETGEPWLEEKIGDYFGIVMTVLPMNSAEFEGCGD